MTRVALQIGECVEVAGVGQKIEIDHPRVRRLEDVVDEVAPDESGPAGDEKGQHRRYSMTLMVERLNRARRGMRCFCMGSAPADLTTVGVGAV